MKVGVIGAGSWGTALASVLAGKEYDTTIWSRGDEVASQINSRHQNKVYLPGIKLPESLRATTDLKEALEGAEFVLAVVPSHAMRQTMEQAAPFIGDDIVVATASKGIEDETSKTMAAVIADAIGHPERVGVISGPSFAAEVVAGRPTVVVAAGPSREVAEKIQEMFQSSALRVYSSTDVVGVEVAGVVKNVIAIATGVSDGLGNGLNARAATITRGLAEAVRLGRAMGARPETFAGLAGMGDLVLTCTGDLSRNRQVGLRLGRGESIENILGGMRMVAEGVRNTKAVRALAQSKGVEMPIVDVTYKVLYEGLPPEQAMAEILARPAKSEFDWA